MDYKESGVDIKKGDDFVEWIQSSGSEQKMPHADQVIGGIGGFAGIFKAGFSHMQEPCLVAATDGIGTKLLLGAQASKVKSLGQDLVAMCVNDLICCGAEPLFFLDYYACGRLDLKQAKDFVGGVRQACINSGLFLLGGETAEMPGLYEKNHFDSAGFAVGVVDRAQVLGPERVQSGDCLVGIESSGFHSNGYSLLRKVFAQDLDQWMDVLLRPTHLYPSLASEWKRSQLDIHAISHITGGGISNISRCLPENLKVTLQAWDWPEPFKEVQKRSSMSDEDMLTSLNCGLGLAVVLPEADVDALMKIAQAQGFKAWRLGQVEEKKTGEPSWSFSK